MQYDNYSQLKRSGSTNNMTWDAISDCQKPIQLQQPLAEIPLLFWLVLPTMDSISQLTWVIIPTKCAAVKQVTLTLITIFVLESGSSTVNMALVCYLGGQFPLCLLNQHHEETCSSLLLMIYLDTPSFAKPNNPSQVCYNERSCFAW